MDDPQISQISQIRVYHEEGAGLSIMKEGKLCETQKKIPDVEVLRKRQPRAWLKGLWRKHSGHLTPQITLGETAQRAPNRVDLGPVPD